jgi:hypothetical protein
MRMSLRSALVCASLTRRSLARGPCSERGFMILNQARQDSNLQPPVLEPTPGNAGVAGLLIFNDLAFRCSDAKR